MNPINTSSEVKFAFSLVPDRKFVLDRVVEEVMLKQKPSQWWKDIFSW